MIRNVVLGRLREAADAEQRAADTTLLDAALAEIAALALPGRLDVHVGRDAGLREGGWDFAIVSDWRDADAYRCYDLDEEHNRIRREGFAPVCSEIARVQLEVPGPG